MTNKSPVYHRMSDGRKVVIVGVMGKLLHTYIPIDDDTEFFHAHELTPWIEPETRTVYVHWDKDNDEYYVSKEPSPSYDGRRKITITEGEFDER